MAIFDSTLDITDVFRQEMLSCHNIPSEVPIFRGVLETATPLSKHRIAPIRPGYVVRSGRRHDLLQRPQRGSPAGGSHQAGPLCHLSLSLIHI